MNSCISNFDFHVTLKPNPHISLQNSPFAELRHHQSIGTTMASTSHGGTSGRIKNLTSTFGSDIQPLVAEIRTTVGVMKDIAVQLEKDNLPDKVKEMEDAVVELVGLSEHSVHFSSAVQAFGNRYKPGEQLTDFHKVLEDEVLQFRANRNSDVQRNPLVRQFKEAVWKVHHSGQPMPGEEEEDIVMTSTQTNILNFSCPVSGKPITELEEPVRSMQCRHIYEKKAIVQYIKSMNNRSQCPIPGCPKAVDVNVLVQDPSLAVDIDELRRTSNKETNVEDFTMLDED
ncbi:unnamed protein product [Trifolium pratense]|uniref:Uncharacterized protein n=1 Tax=Trifolium pratense TaxID=57577 RepID=A0ACB0KRF4_TRIPR|nr:unnamed protein product [Trifolium pratense]